MSLSNWGGSFNFNKGKCVFVNTCPVDNWLALFCSLSYENPEVYQNFIRKLRKYVILTCKKEHVIFMGTSTHYLQNI